MHTCDTLEGRGLMRLKAELIPACMAWIHECLICSLSACNTIVLSMNNDHTNTHY